MKPLSKIPKLEPQKMGYDWYNTEPLEEKI